MKLYYAPGACSLAAHIALEESGVDFEAIRVDLSTHRTEDGEDFYAISPRGYVPAIETGEHGLITENPAVLMLIADRYGGAPTGTDRYKMLEWIGFTGTEIHGGYHPLFRGDDAEAKQAAKESLAQKYDLAARLMGDTDWLVGDRPSVADYYMFVTTLWAGKFRIALPGAIIDFRTRNLDRESVKQAMAAEGLG